MKLPDFNPYIMDRATKILHVLESLLIPIIMGVTIASLLQNSTGHSSARFMFAMAWLTIPMLIYVSLTPRFERAKPLAHPYALLGFNSVYCFLWFIAFAALAAHNNSTISSGYQNALNDTSIPADKKPTSASCATTASGSPKECELNKADIALAVFLWLFLLASTLISSYIALYFRVNLCTPLDAAESKEGQRVAEATKDAFDTNAASTDDRHTLMQGEDDVDRDPRWKDGGRTPSGSAESLGAGYYDRYGEDYERDQARHGEGNRSTSVGSGSYDAGRVGFPEGDYEYTGTAAKR